MRTVSLGVCTGALCALAVTYVLAEPDDAALIKHAPDAQAQPYRERLQSLLLTKYPRLLIEKVDGVAVVTLIFNPDGTLANSGMDVTARAPAQLTVSEGQFARFGVSAGELRYIGVSQIQLPLNTVLVAFAGSDTRRIDRALVERYFSDTLRGGRPLNGSMWILFDHSGQVVRTGTERFSPTGLRDLLEHRYPGIRTSDMTVTPVIGPDGQPMRNSRREAFQLYCVWLSAESPKPQD
jgi:hypothetical protein